MNLKQRLIDDDPVAREPELDAFQVQAMRQRVLAEARTESSAAPGRWWLSSIAVTGSIAVCLLIAIAIGIRIGGGNSGRPAAPAPSAREDAPRQLRFSAPGGTRIIWTFHQHLEL